MTTRYRIVLSFLISVFFLCSCNESDDFQAKKSNFDFAVLKIGKADAIILSTEKHNIIIDCGEEEDGEEVVEYLAENGISTVDHIFITHFDKDHVGGLPKVIESVTVKGVFVPNYEGNNRAYEKYLQAIDRSNLTATVLTEDMLFTVDDVLLEVSVPKSQSYAEEDNDFSLVISATHGDNTFLFAGDAEEERLSELLSETEHTYDFLKVPHHGKYNKNTVQFINTVKPTYSVICDSKKNPAEDETVSALYEVESEVYFTKNGNVYVSSDGKQIYVFQY